MDEAALVHLAKGRRNADGEVQETSHLHRRAEVTAQQLPARIVEHQNGPSTIAHKLKRPHRPCAVQLMLEGVFVGKANDGSRSGLLRGWKHEQHGIRLAKCALTPPPAEGDATILGQDLEATDSIHAEPRRWPHSQIPSVEPAARSSLSSDVSIA
jgi:hypothetical protein